MRLLLTLLATTLTTLADNPNIILIMADDLGWGDVGFNGNTVVQTPHLDAMAENGAVFTRFYAAAPVCSPTRGSCLTGRHPSRYSIPYANSGHMLPEEETLAEMLRKHGYATGHFGKWHLGTLTKTVVEANRGGPRGAKHYAPPQDHGFDVTFCTESKVPTHSPMREPQVYAEDASRRIGWDALSPETPWKHYKTHYWNEGGEMILDDLLDDDSKLIVDHAIPFMKSSVEAKKPFFAVVWFHAPHLPVVASEKHRAPYRDLDLHARNYFGCITALDEQVGRIRTVLRELKAAENTMLWFCSDNGPEGNAKSPGSAGTLRGRKRSLYEGGVRVPGLLEWPAKIKPGRTINEPAVTSDYLPTVADVLEIKPSAAVVDGTSLLPMIESGASRAKPIGFVSRQLQVWMDGHDKLVVNGKSGETELYNLSVDPEEKRDLASQAPDRVKAMKQALDAWLADCKVR